MTANERRDFHNLRIYVNNSMLKVRQSQFYEQSTCTGLSSLIRCMRDSREVGQGLVRSKEQVVFAAVHLRMCTQRRL